MLVLIIFINYQYYSFFKDESNYVLFNTCCGLVRCIKILKNIKEISINVLEKAPPLQGYVRPYIGGIVCFGGVRTLPSC